MKKRKRGEGRERERDTRELWRDYIPRVLFQHGLGKSHIPDLKASPQSGHL